MDLRGLLLLLCAILVALPVFALGLIELAESWSTPAYSHGPVVAIMSLWIGLRALRDEPEDLRARTDKTIWPGAVLVLAGLLIGAIGTLSRVGDVSAYGLIIWIGGMVFLLLGWDRARRLWLPVVLLLFILPLPQFLYWQLTTFLQHVSAVLGVDMIRAVGLAVYLDGNIIDLGVYRLQVAEACSGLQFLFPVISFALLFAAISRAPIWHKVLLVALSAPLAVLMNSARIALTALIVDQYGIESAEGFLHAFEGWTILLACIVILAALMLFLRILTPKARQGGRVFDLDTRGLPQVLGRVQNLAPAPSLLLAVIAGVFFSALVLLPGHTSEQLNRSAFDRFPIQLDSWLGIPNRLDPRVEAVIDADDYVDMTYISRDTETPVHLFAAYYSDQTNGSALHSPQVCLPANGWEVTEFGTRRLDMTGTGYGSFDANRAEIIKGTERQLVYYWFEQRGTRITNDFVAKIDMLVDGITRDRRDGAIIRFVTPIQGDDLTGAEERIRKLMRSALPKMPNYIPF
ncbi:VPLPA-CTERM-specific exosortase XrtD [Primorskyibacter sp. 2E233]|uniref:VPLPA-CTERM-specific exosortase XrtD n=1 Tax=Primorskyibacter sp. 2E233 TaxID=3413431 RepID=UPI003BF42CCE